jgi:hypothetical protein
MNKRQLWLEQEKERKTASAIVDAQKRAVDARKRILMTSWVAAGISTIAAIGGVIEHDRHPAVGLTVSAALWMTALHATDNMGEREPPRALRWAIYAFAAVSSVILIVSLFHRH